MQGSQMVLFLSDFGPYLDFFWEKLVQIGTLKSFYCN